MSKNSGKVNEEIFESILLDKDIDLTMQDRSLKNDIVFKVFFGKKGNEKYLISFLEALLNIKIEKVEIIPEASLDFLSTEDKWGRLDIKATINDKEIINIEMQLENEHDMKKRTIFYGSRLVVEQLTKRDQYKELKPVILINILNFNLLDLPEYHTETVIVAKQNRDYEVITDIKYHFIELPKFRKAKPRLSNILECWLALIDSKDGGLIEMAKEKEPIIREAKKELEEILTSKQLRAILNFREDALREEASRKGMAMKRGEEIGKKIGKEIGKQEGIEQGRNEEKEKIAKEMLKDKVNIETIIKYTGLAKEEIERLSSID